MYEKIPTAGMGNEEWLTLKKTGIGGSDAGAICGVNPFSSLVLEWKFWQIMGFLRRVLP